MGIHGLNYLKIKEAIGKPYQLIDSEPPHSFNCWTLIQYLYPQAPSFEPEKLKEYVELFNSQKATLEWDEVIIPKEGDIMLFAKRDYYSHAGIYLAHNKVLHAKDKIGVVIEDINMVKLRYKNIKAYRWL